MSTSSTSSVAAGRAIAASVTRPRNYATRCALRMVGGDLTERVDHRAEFDGKDEPSQLFATM